MSAMCFFLFTLLDLISNLDNEIKLNYKKAIMSEL